MSPQAHRGLTVATGAADLLGVAFQALGQVVVIDGSDVRLVDAHAEGYGRHHHGRFGGQKPLLGGGAVLALHASVIGPRRDAVSGQPLGHLLGRPLQGDIDNRRPRRSLLDPAQQDPVALVRLDRRGKQLEVRSVEAGAHGRGGVDPKARADIVQHLRRGGGRQRQRALGAAGLGEDGQLEVVGTEVVAPLGDTVGLVDREQSDRLTQDRLPEPLVVEALRGRVEKAQLARPDAIHDRAVLLGGERRVEPRGGNAARRELVHLILHQGDEGRHHHGEALQQQGRQLVAQRLAATGREHRRRGAACQQVSDHRLLAVAEGLVAKSLLEQPARVVHRVRHGHHDRGAAALSEHSQLYSST